MCPGLEFVVNDPNKTTVVLEWKPPSSAASHRSGKSDRDTSVILSFMVGALFGTAAFLILAIILVACG